MTICAQAVLQCVRHLAFTIATIVNAIKISIHLLGLLGKISIEHGQSTSFLTSIIILHDIATLERRVPALPNSLFIMLAINVSVL